MSRSKLLTASLATLVALSATAKGQSAVPAGPHMIIVRLIDKGVGAKPFAFEPASVVAQHGDTVRFLEAADVMHNVRFTKHAPGAHLGGAETGPYLTAKGQKYDLVIDKRFTDGTYEYVCDPHAAIGMKGTLVVTP
jgi:plastocyanin